MNLIDIQTKAAQYKFKLSTTARKTLVWNETVALSVVGTLNQIIETSDLQNFAHVIKTEGTDGDTIYLNLLHIEKSAAKILDSSDKEKAENGKTTCLQTLAKWGYRHLLLPA